LTMVAVQYRGVSLSFLEELKWKYGRMNGYGLLTSLIRPMTKDGKISLAELWSQKVSGRYKAFGKVTVFISHAWKTQFGSLVEAIASWERSQNFIEDVVYYFFDIFAINQWDPQRDLRATEKIIAEANALVLVLSPLSNPIPLSRVWCLFEIYTAIKNKTAVMSALPDRERKKFQTWSMANSWHDLIDIEVDSRNAEATKLDDALRIKDVIKREIGFTRLNRQIHCWLIKLIRKVALDKADHVRGTPMFEEYSASRDRLSNKIKQIMAKYNDQIQIENDRRWDQKIQNLLLTKTDCSQIDFAVKKRWYLSIAKKEPIFTDEIDSLIYHKAFISLQNFKEKRLGNFSDIFEWTSCYRNYVDMSLLPLLEVFSEFNIPSNVFEIILECLPDGWLCGGIGDEILTKFSWKKSVNSARVFKWNEIRDNVCSYVNDDILSCCAKCSEDRFWKCCAGKIMSEFIFCPVCNRPRWYIVKEGYLKDETRLSNELKKWRQRWFVLTNKKLFAFENWNILKSPTIEFDLSNVVKLKNVEESIFMIDTKDSLTYTINAGTNSNCLVWVRVIEKALNQLEVQVTVE